MGVTQLRIAGHLMLASLPAQLQHVLVDLTQTGGTDWLAIGEATAIGVNREAAVNAGRTRGNQLLLLTVLSETVFGHVHNLCT